LKLKSIRIRNFLSFGEQAAEMQFDRSGITFVVGPNNSGKSNIFRTLSFVADCIATEYSAISPTPYLRPGRRDFEIAVEIELNEAELQALRDFLVCANMLYNFGGEPAESQVFTRVRNEILSKHGGTLFSSLSGEIGIIVKGTEREGLQFKRFLRLRWGQEEFLLQQNSYLAKLEVPETSGFGYQIFSVLLIDDFRQRYPAELKELGQREEVVDGTYAPPDMPKLLASKLVSETTKPGQTAFTGVQLEQLSFNGFEQRIGITEPLRRLRGFLSARGLSRDQISFNDLIAMIYANSIVWVPDMRGSPPDYQHVSWERPVEQPGAQYWGGAARPQILTIGAADLPARLFGLLTSVDPTDQRHYDEIQAEFGEFADGLRFRVFLEEKEVAVAPEINLVRVPQAQPGITGLTPIPESVIVGTQGSEGRKKVKVVGLQMLDGAASWPIGFASAGTVEVLLLLTGTIGTKDKVLLLDEPAQNMHPEFQSRFLDLLRRHVKENVNQALVITHSPFLLTKDCFGDTWRISRKKEGATAVLRVAQALAEPCAELPGKIVQQLDSGDVRSLLFSRGAVFVEGLSDKWVLQEIDRKASLAGRSPSLVEKEWAVVAMNARGNTRTFLDLAELLGLDFAFLLDADAKPIVEGILKMRGLQPIDEKTMRDNGFFVLKTDIDDLFSIQGSSKPLKALDKALEMRLEDVPSEFQKFLAFLKQRT
jgi:hypothetical protein